MNQLVTDNRIRWKNSHLSKNYHQKRTSLAHHPLFNHLIIECLRRNRKRYRTCVEESEDYFKNPNKNKKFQQTRTIIHQTRPKVQARKDYRQWKMTSQASRRNPNQKTGKNDSNSLNRSSTTSTNKATWWINRATIYKMSTASI